MYLKLQKKKRNLEQCSSDTCERLFLTEFDQNTEEKLEGKVNELFLANLSLMFLFILFSRVKVLEWQKTETWQKGKN